ncbi:Uma2 family endonuclease [Catenibacillus scindens]|uniref:Uma2 family endonuclease n=1 Tax=Catenibacillus scindens TaxID=673271 RepID=A0A7W8M5M2_9FIRM|nr:Uma2 family endonuclease [Catenibacillus scindens]MBB5264506.1 Uma2 family endonuclease [Catenibacillus scindens]
MLKYSKRGGHLYHWNRRNNIQKLLKYKTAGVREYWIVDPMVDQVIVYKFDTDILMQYSFTDEIPVAIYDGDLRLKIKTE